MTRFVRGAVGALLIVFPAALGAQGGKPLDRSQPPPVAPAPAFHAPRWAVDTLSNGARLVVVERHDLPIVTFSMHFEGGTNQLGTKLGVSNFVGAMMREGTTSRTGDQLNDDLALLGTNVGFGVGEESGSVNFSCLTRTFDPTLAIMMDMMLHSTFPEASLERLRAQALASYTRGQDVVGVVASEITPKLLYGDQPYGKVVNEADLRAVTRDDVANLAHEFFVPANATIYVVGDLTRAAAKASLERAFRQWPASGRKLAVSYPAAPAAGSSTIYMVDMPGKPQSELVLTRTIPPEYSPDMAKIDVMNAILGGMFQSRLNADIRELHGFSYGFNSFPLWMKGPGSLRAQGAVTREKTDSSLMLAMDEIRGLTGGKPVTTDELTAARNSLTLSLPSDLQSNAGTASVVARVVDNGLPRDWWSRYIAQVNGTTASDVAAMAAQYMDPAHLIILVVGDAAKIAAPIRATGIAPVVNLDKTGRPISP
ncbi:MAG: M16 family metallopeptidase [Gemmatimonadales bacterium]